MAEPLSLRSYHDWQHCITELCHIPLTPGFVEGRIAALNDRCAYETQRFIQTWGETHLHRVKGWFLQARDELRTGGGA